jgi:hypothetical protein
MYILTSSGTPQVIDTYIQNGKHELLTPLLPKEGLV